MPHRRLVLDSAYWRIIFRLDGAHASRLYLLLHLAALSPSQQQPQEMFMSAIIHHMLDTVPVPVAPFSHAVEVVSLARYRRTPEMRMRLSRLESRHRRTG